MARVSVMIPIQADALRTAVQKRQSLSSLEESLGVTRQAINGWLNTQRIPPRKLSTIAEKLDLSTEELNQITTPKKDSRVLFRTLRNVPVTDEHRDEAIRMANDFFALDVLRDASPEKVVIQINSDDALAVADTLLKQLDLQRERLSLDVLIHSLERLNIHVIFVDFTPNRFAETSGTKEPTQNKSDRAFCVKQEKKYVIVIDSSQKADDVMFNIFHELAHIFLGHLDSKQAHAGSAGTKEQEKFCTAIAVQVMTPDSYFQERKRALKERFSCSYPALPFLIEDIAKELSSSFEGVIYALDKHKIISYPQKGYLLKIDRYRDGLRPSVRNFIAPKPDQDLFDFWSHAFNSKDHEKFLKLQNLVKRAIAQDRISISRAAELFDIGEIQMEHLAVQWREEYESLETAD